MSADTANPVPEMPDIRIDNVLVPLDGSAFASAALPTARVIAELFKAQLHTVSVAGGSVEAEALARLAAEALDLDVSNPRVATAVSDDPAAAIADHAEGLGSCLICLSTHGRGRLSGSVIGSVARSLVHASSAPLIALGPSAERTPWAPHPNRRPPLTYNRILACVDGSAASEEVLPVASAWARTLGMSLTIVIVVADAPSPIQPRPTEGDYVEGPTPESYIDKLVELWQSDAIHVSGQVIRDPIGPARGIQAYQEEHEIGLVALTTHARSGFARVLFGAAAANIVHASLVPCLLIPLRPAPSHVASSVEAADDATVEGEHPST
jgi:nucleotide-binding universal stress UspA family protein